jgi:AAA15 family ATPase/GTPase
LLHVLQRLIQQGSIFHEKNCQEMKESKFERFEYIYLMFTPLEYDLLTPFMDGKTIEQGLKSDYFIPADRNIALSQLPKIIFLPSESHFEHVQTTHEPYAYTYSFFNQVDERISQSVPAYFATFIDRKIFENEELPAKESINQACDEINTIFENLDLESRLIGLKKDGSRMPIFENTSGKEFDITGLSSGEKQLFFRIMALKMFEANNSVILIDEPEISLHPAWQQKIIKVYENIGENNQVIVATHSPHIIASTPKENVKILTRNEETNTFQVIDYTQIHATKGVPVERILKDVMGLPTTRDPEIQHKIDGLWRLIHTGEFDTDAFERQYKEFEDLVGTTDDDVVLMKLEIGKRKWERDNAHA